MIIAFHGRFHLTTYDVSMAKCGSMMFLRIVVCIHCTAVCVVLQRASVTPRAHTGCSVRRGPASVPARRAWRGAPVTSVWRTSSTSQLDA